MQLRIGVTTSICMVGFAFSLGIHALGANEELLEQVSPAGLSLGQQLRAMQTEAMHGESNSVEGQFSKLQIDRWIEFLGSDHYTLRKRAESALLRMGTDAFDQLKSVENHTDLEIATRARYILGQINIEWVRAQDPEGMPKWMRQYGEFSEPQRRKSIQRLTELKSSCARSALCRIARFDSSPLLSREAALAVIDTELVGDEAEKASAIASMTQELGSSSRKAVMWIRTWLQQEDPSQWGAPASEVERWTQMIDEEIQQLSNLLSTDQPPITDESIVLDLLHHQLALCKQHHQSDVMVVTLEKIVDLHIQSGGAAASGLAYALDWLLHNEQWQVLNRLEAGYGDTIEVHRELLYRVAAIRSKQEQWERATEIANRAFHLEANDVENRNALASELVELGHFDWAEREWRYITRSFPVSSDEALTANRDLSMWLHDRLRHLESAKLLQSMFDKFASNAEQVARVLNNTHQRYWYNTLKARMHYYYACHAEKQADYASQRVYLRKAIDQYEIDADVLIAMYRLKGADEEYRSATLKRIQATNKVLSEQIREYPNSTIILNHKAWLIANTEGDYQEALACSRDSLKWEPEEATLLDTYARCLYATGDLEGALEQQKKAVKLESHVHALKRQLAFFEQELDRRTKNKGSSSLDR